MADPKLAPLARLVGTWTTEATHPAMPGVVVHGTANIDWLEGERFLILRARTDHPDFPDSISVIGFVDRDRAESQPTDSTLVMQYYDSRGVFRSLDVSIDDTTWRIERLAPGFSQKFTGTFGDGGATIDGLWLASEDGEHWKDDLRITYRRRR